MKVVFLICSIVGFVYFFFKKRKFDFFTMAYISANVYFLPGFFGYVVYYPAETKVELLPEVYLVMTCVLTSILMTSIIYDLVGRKQVKQIKFKNSELNLRMLLIISIASFVLMFITMGNQLFVTDKVILMSNLNRFYLVWSVSTSLLIITAFIERKIKIVCFGFIFLAFDIYLGFRSNFAITVISIFTIYMNQKKFHRLIIGNFRLFVLGGIAAVFFFVYKQIHAVIKLGRWDIVTERLVDLNFYFNSIIHSEPFVIQSTLNEVINQNFTVSPSYLMNILYLFIFFAPQLGANIKDFNDYFQPTLFPNVDFGMASNIWAEMYSINGWSTLILFIIFFNIVIFLANKFLLIENSSIKSVVTLIMIYWVFYIHRNSILYEINLSKRILFIWIISMMGSIIFLGLFRKRLTRDNV